MSITHAYIGCNTRKREIRRWAIAVASAVLALASARSARAGFTEATPNKDGEPGQGAILSHVLGGDFTANGNNFTNGTITATQLDDNADQIWSGSIISAQAVAAFSVDPEMFGYVGGAGQGNFVPLFTTSGHGYDVTGSSGPTATPETYQLARGGMGTFTSVAANNPDGDHVHVLAYAISSLPNQAPNTKTWMLFWEDTIAQYSDWDYNDLVVKLETDPPGPNAAPLLIPLPPAVWSGLSGLVALLVVAGIARIRRAQLVGG